MSGRIPYLWRIAALFALQALALGWMVYDRMQILRSGTEIRLPVRPVDPRDLFRGDYVTLTYDISMLRTPLLDGDDKFQRHERVFVVLETAGDGSARPVSVHRSFPDVAAGRVVIAGRARSISSNLPIPVGEAQPDCPHPCAGIIVRYGIESYFVPEGEGRAIEKQRDVGQIEVLVAVDESGEAAIKGLIVDGTLRYEEPLF